jgi:uncharacterized membrane protein
LVFIVITLWKYLHLGYNGLDLAIFNQVLYNSSWGNFYYFTIHPQSYLGDHFNLWLSLLTPLYALWRQPFWILIWQTVLLGASAWPLYRLAKNFVSPVTACLVGWLWLINPFIQNTNVFEFHELPLAVFLLFWVLVFWLEKRPGRFYLFAFLALIVREDVALVIMMFGVLALIEKKTILWWWPLPLGLSWFFLATKIIGFLNPLGQYKFLYYYQWLGANLSEMIINGLTHPWLIIEKMVAPQNLAMTLALFLPFAFINFRPSRYWLLGLPIYFQLILGGSLNALIVTKTHYSNLLLIPLFLVFLVGLNHYQTKQLPTWWQKIFSSDKKLAAIVITVAMIYVSLALGPILPWVNQVITTNKQTLSWIKTQWQIIKTIPNHNSLLTSYYFLSPLSSREKIYALNYAFTGKQQLSDKDYQLPADLETILIDTSDIIFYQIQSQNSGLWKKQYPTGSDRLNQLFYNRDFTADLAVDSIVKFNRFSDYPLTLWTTSSLATITQASFIETQNAPTFLGWTDLKQQNFKTAGTLLPISLFWQTKKLLTKDWQIKLSITNGSGKEIYYKIIPLTYGLYPSSHWQTNEVVQTNYWFYLPPDLPKNSQVQLELVYPQGYLTLDGLVSLVYRAEKSITLKPFYSVSIDSLITTR